MKDTGRGGNYQFIVFFLGCTLLQSISMGLFGFVFQPGQKISNGSAAHPVYSKV